MVLMYLYKHMKYDSRAEVLDIVQAQARLMGFLRKAKLWPFEGRPSRTRLGVLL